MLRKYYKISNSRAIFYLSFFFHRRYLFLSILYKFRVDTLTKHITSLSSSDTVHHYREEAETSWIIVHHKIQIGLRNKHPVTNDARFPAFEKVGE